MNENLSQKFQKALASKNAIRDKLNEKGCNVGDIFEEYADAIDGLINLNQPVTNLTLDKYGVLTFDGPDATDLAEYEPTFSYVVNVNGIEVETTKKKVNIYKLLTEGKNNISVIVRANLKQNENIKEELIEYIPSEYTSPDDFTLEAVTVGEVSGYKVTAYNGSETEINIPEFARDGLPILSCGNIAVPKITGLHIKTFDSFAQNTTITHINFPNTTELTDTTNYFKDCTELTEVILDTSNVTNMSGMFMNIQLRSNLKSVLISTDNATNLYCILRGCRVMEELPLWNTSNALNMQEAFVLFHGSLVPAYNLSNAIHIRNILQYCYYITSILMYGMKADFSISSCTLLEAEALVTVLSNCQVVTSTKALIMGSTLLAKLENVYVKETGIELYEGITCRPCVICESTDEGAMLATDYITSKGWSVS